ncbi:UBA/THIF-type NAD/FAD binding protein [Solidesulfovibrio fructosivorans JJ]]|uniref:Molybdopterin-synthase adenylyltransferase n=1 Tax=Solidesulfovibrio fructosivorans JJ] TaxID=596151 RepID=E1JXZ1_SOLFR|nr:HesA/MoeB/ThiF family protein [Solidesulfovibrio fructosivorans]EFL50729.1 UBA/THIF-type NAD/FAD binding protein [Solidesulfovibrio fructosivorans JJ]]
MESEAMFLERYSRHIVLPGIGIEGQRKIARGKVLVIGAGGLGSPVAYYLAAAGVGVLGILDCDVVDRSNLQRQILHATDDIGRPKVVSAKEKLERLNPDVSVRTYDTRIDASNIGKIIAPYDFVVDGVDNFQTKFLINDACILAGIPFSMGGVLQFVGQTMTVLPGKSACYRCVMGDVSKSAPTCAEKGLLGPVPGITGTIQAAEALKYLTGAGELLCDNLLLFDATAMEFMKSPVRRNPDCPACGEHHAPPQPS